MGFGEVGLRVLFVLSGRRRVLAVLDFQVHFGYLVGEVVVLLLAFPWRVQRVPCAFQIGFRIVESDAEALRRVGVVGDDPVELSDDVVGAVVDVGHAGAGPMLMLAFQADERTERVDAFDGHVLRRDHDGQPAVFADFHRLPVVEPVRDADEVVDGLLAVRDRTVAEIKPAYALGEMLVADLDGLVEFRLVVHRFPVEFFEVVHGRLQLHVDLETDRPLLVRVGAFEQFHLRELVFELHAFGDVRVSGGDGLHVGEAEHRGVHIGRFA